MIGNTRPDCNIRYNAVVKKTIEKIFEVLLYGLPLALIAGILDYRFHNYFWPNTEWFRLFSGGAMFDFSSILQIYLLVLGLIYLLMIALIKEFRPKLCWNWSFLAVILIAFGGVSAFSHYQGTPPVIKSFPAQMGTNYLLPLLLFFILFFAFSNSKWRSGFEKSLLISFGLFGALIIFEYFSDLLPGANRDFLGRLVWPYIDPFFDLKAESANWLAFLFGPVMMLSLIRMREKWPLLVGTIALIVVLLSKSYTSIGVLGLLVFIYLLVTVKKSWRKWIVLGAVVLGVILVATQYNTAKFQILIGKYDYSKANSIERREQIYAVNAVALAENLLVGLGPGNYQNYFRGKMAEVLPVPIPEEEIPPHPHNLALNFWSDLGLFGLVAMILIYIVTGFELLKNRLPYYFLLAYPLGHGLVDTPYGLEEVSILFWILMALAASE